MKRQLNKNEFLRCARGLKNAEELEKEGYLKEALLELRPVLQTLEKQYEMSRMLAKCYILKAQILDRLQKNSQAETFWLAAKDALESVNDATELMDQVQLHCPKGCPENRQD